MKIKQIIDELRESFLEYTRKAFSLLPEMGNPRILDVGCGRGLPTIELAKLSGGQVIGIDIDSEALDEFRNEIKNKQLSNRIKILNKSLLNKQFQEDYSEWADVVWGEGVFHMIGYEEGYKCSYKLLKSGGYLVINDLAVDIIDSLPIIEKIGFRVSDYFQLPEEVWWTEFYKPLEKRIEQLTIDDLNQASIEEINQFETEIEMVKENPKNFDCAFYIFQKT
ncbi:MAG: methyltransferase domain-containing protein [Candidatus Lokiarchaeota archaeon]|nr:methyltransferase domain-containing protein [Candidatus Lokiarchaeota archaeon]MBD3340734.1 methyltransferase domain-containing protein [Candidatus Lokiarchaeota archaeon]